MRETAATTGTSARSVEERTADDPTLSDKQATTGSDSGGDPGTGPARTTPGHDESTTTEPTDSAAGEPAGAGPAGSVAGDRADGAAAAPSVADGVRAATGSPPEAQATPPVMFTRPPGMVPPPDRPADPDGHRDSGSVTGSRSRAWTGASGSHPALGTTAPARLTGRTSTSGVSARPIATESGGTNAVGAARVAEPVRSRAATTPRGPRRARLHLKRVDPWSVMKFSFAVSLVLFIVVIVASAVLYLALDTMGVFASINSTVAELIQSGAGEGGGGFQITAQGVIGSAAVLGALNVLLFTSLATLGAFIYNVCADLVGGVEMTLAERD